MLEPEALFKFPIAVSCFGAQRMLGLLPIVSDWEPVRAVQKTLYEAGEAAKKDFKTDTLLFGAFQFTDKAQAAMAALASDTMKLKVLKPSYMMDMVSDMMQGSSDAFDAVASGNARTRLREQFENTADVLDFVNHADAPTKLSADGTYPLEERVAEYYGRGDYPALWLIEGLGERYAEAHLAADRDVRELLTSGPGAALPEKTQLMMHAGIGIAFAKHELKKLNPWSSDNDIKDRLKRFVEMVRQNSMPGFEGAALESLGLVARTWFPQLVEPIDKHLADVDAGAIDFFWHGAGRAMYFSPMYMVPGLSPWQAADEEPPNENARLNARAGVAWAFTIVNVRQPGIMALFLKHKASRIKDNGAFTNGVHSALVMAGDMVPGHRFVSEFEVYRPDAGDSKLVESWDKHVGNDLRNTIDTYRDSLRVHRQLGEIFRYHALPEFIGNLDVEYLSAKKSKK